MALMNYGHVFASGGISGGHWDITSGYGIAYTTTAGDLALTSGPKTAVLTAGTWPTGFQSGRVFTTDDATNPGPFTILSRSVDGKTLVLKEAVVTDTPVGAVAIDASTDVGIQDVLLGVGDGALTEDCPYVLTSTGALGAARVLDISGTEVESAAHGGETLEGRLMYLAVLNSDISPTNTLTIVSSNTINGEASLVVQNQGDYLLRYGKNGEWRFNVLPRPAEGTATIARVPFTAADWNAGTPLSTLTVLQSGTPGLGEVGPHNLTTSDTYVVQVYNTDTAENEIVNVEVQVTSAGDIILLKARSKPAFNGYVVVIGSLD